MDALAFNYSILDTGVQGEVRQYARRLGELSQAAACNLWDMGHILSEAQGKLASYGNGTFTQWITNETGLSPRTCYRLIYIYRAFDSVTMAETTLATSVLYMLAEPSTPAEARNEVLNRASKGETITTAKAQEIVASHRPELPPKPPLPTRPLLPVRPPSPAYREFEREELLPKLHDAGVVDAPQMLSGQSEVPQLVPEKQKEQARDNLREAVIEQLVACQAGQDVEASADEILDILGKGNNSIAVAARVGIALASGPQTLADLTAIAVWACGGCLDRMERAEYLRWRKKTLRLIDSLTFCGGAAVYEHKLENGQIAYGLLGSQA